MKKTAWSITFYFLEDEEDYRTFVLSPYSRYRDPHEWKERNNTIRKDKHVKLIDYRPLSEEEYIKEYHNYYKNYRHEWLKP